MKTDIPFQQFPSAEINQKDSKNIIKTPLNTHISSEINLLSRNIQESIKPKESFEGMKRYESNKITLKAKNPENISLAKENSNISNRNNKNSNIIISKFSNKKTGEKRNAHAAVAINKEEKEGGQARPKRIIYTVKREKIELKNKGCITPFNRNNVSANRNIRQENSINLNNINKKGSFNNKNNNNIANNVNIKEYLDNNATNDVNKNNKTVNNTNTNVNKIEIIELKNKDGTRRLNRYNVSPNRYNNKENVINKNNTYFKQSVHNKNNNITNKANIKESLDNKITNDANKDVKTINITNNTINKRRIIDISRKDMSTRINSYNVSPNRYNLKENSINQNNTNIKESLNNRNNIAVNNTNNNTNKRQIIELKNKDGTTRFNRNNVSPNRYNIKENTINQNNIDKKQSFNNKNNNNITNKANIKESLDNKITNDTNKTVNNTNNNTNKRQIIELKNKDGTAQFNRNNVSPNRYNIKENTINQNNIDKKQSFNNKNNNNITNKANIKESLDNKITNDANNNIKNINDTYNVNNRSRRNTNNNKNIKNTNITNINTNNNKNKNENNDNNESANSVNNQKVNNESKIKEEENQNKPLSIEEQNIANEKEKKIVRRRNPNASKYEKRISNKNIIYDPNGQEKNDKKVKSIKKIKGKKNLKMLLALKMKILKSIKMLKLIEAFSATSYIKSCEATSTAGRDDDGEIKTNQDTALLERNVNGVSNFNIFGVLDGHGENGHLSSQFVCKFIINKIKYHPALKNLKSSKEIYKKFTENNYELITKIYMDADTQIAKEKFNCEMSGTTCVLVFQLDEHLICSNAGDSRAILVYEDKKSINLQNSKVFLLSNDCKPELPEEKKRIEERGGCVKQYLDEGDIPSGPFRVWIKGEFYPGIAISRTIGDLDAKKVGVIPNPLFIEYTLDEKAKYMIICSDGIWEFISNEEVMKIANSYYLKKDAYGLCQDLTKIATERWLKEDIVVDDITVVAAFF